MPPRENWLWEEKVSKNTQIKLFSDEYHGVNCSLPSQSLDPIIPRRPRSQSVSGHVVQAFRIRHHGELTETGKRSKKLFLGALLEACRCPDCSIEMSLLCFRKCQIYCLYVCWGGGGRGRWGRRTRLCLFVCFLDSTKSGFRYFYFIHFIHLFYHYHIKHTYISQKF